jgi:6-phosphofructokinase 1
MANYEYPSVSYEIAARIQQATGREVRVTVPGHTQRGGAPDAYDRVFSTQVGAAAGKLILKKQYGFMVALVDGEITKIPLSEVAGKLKTVDPNAQIIKHAKLVGISFGD